MALALFLCSAVTAQAQDTNRFVIVEMVTQPAAAARMGGENETSGSVWLTFSTAAAAVDTTVTLHYSVPLAMAFVSSVDSTTYTSAVTDVMGTAENDDNDGNGTVVLTGLLDEATATTLVIRNVPLDVSGASGPVTVMAEVESSNPTDFLRFDGPNIGPVISDIVVGVTATGAAVTVRTRGTMPGGIMAELTLEESFKGAFMRGNDLEIEFSGIPDEVTLTAEVTGIKIASDTEAEVRDDPLVTTDDTDPYATVSAVSSDGKATVMLGGDDMSNGSTMRVAPDKVVLNLTLTAATDNDEISFPLDMGDVMARVTFTDDMDDNNTFVDAFTDYVTVFMIRPAQCELLFPVVTVMPMANGDWETAISVTNPAFTGEMAAGGLTFTFYPMRGEPVVYETSGGSPGSGLEPDGTLAPGGTYQVLVSQILSSADWGDSFQGHVHLLTDYTQCSGLGWVTDWMGVNQAYSAVVVKADTGK